MKNIILGSVSKETDHFATPSTSDVNGEDKCNDSVLETDCDALQTDRNPEKIKNKQRSSWSKTQKTYMLKHFQKHIKNLTTPRKEECLSFQKKHLKLFEAKTWTQIKIFVYNTFRNK